MARFRGRLGRCALGVTLAAALSGVFAPPASAAPGDLLWEDLFKTFFFYEKVLVASSGQVFAVGYGGHWGTDSEYLTVSLDRDGNELWSTLYRGPDQGDPASDTDRASDAALGPTEHRIYVTGASEKPGSGSDWATVAYRTDGSQLWVRRHDGPASGDDEATAVAVNPRTGRIFVTGRTAVRKSDTAITTVAYSPAGDRLWTRRVSSPVSDAGPAARLDRVSASLGSNGRRLYVSGSVETKDSGRDVSVTAYRPNGSKVWRRQYDGPGNGDEVAASSVIGPNGRHVYVTGASEDAYLTLCYRRDGTRLWTQRYAGPVGGKDTATDAAVSADGLTLFVTGHSDAATADDAATVAYSSEGDELWVRAATRSQADVAVNPNADEVFVSLGGSASTTTAYTFDGDEIWVRGNEGAESKDVAVSPDGSFVVVAADDDDVYPFPVLVAYSTG